MLLPAALLGGPAGEDGGDAAVRLLLDRLHHKADRFAHPGEQGDVPHRAVRHAQRPLLPGDDALTEAEIDQQIVLLGAEEGAGLEDGSGSQRLPEARRAPAEGFVLFGMNQPAFRRKSSHFFYLLLFCPPVWADVRGSHAPSEPSWWEQKPSSAASLGGRRPRCKKVPRPRRWAKTSSFQKEKQRKILRWCGYLCYNRICMQGSCKKEAVFAWKRESR